MKAVLISIQPKWCELIASGKKTVEVRKTKPKLETPFKCYIYFTKWKDNTYWKNHYKDKLGKVIGEFVCDCLISLKADNHIQAYYNNTIATCLTDAEIVQYANNGRLYYWNISDLVIYDKPKELSEFRKFISFLEGESIEELEKCGMNNLELKRPPQSWCYVESLQDNDNPSVTA